MNEEKMYLDSILEKLSTIHNVKWLKMIYGFVRVFAENEEGGAAV